jgi:hypothetical protein
MGLGSTARRPVGYQIAHLNPLTITFGSANGNHLMGTVPRGSRILGTYLYHDGFTAVGVSALTVGTNGPSTYNNIAPTITEETAQETFIAGGGALTLTQDTEVYARWTHTGTALTAGTANLVLAYVCPAEIDA